MSSRTWCTLPGVSFFLFFFFSTTGPARLARGVTSYGRWRIFGRLSFFPLPPPLLKGLLLFRRVIGFSGVYRRTTRNACRPRILCIGTSRRGPFSPTVFGDFRVARGHECRATRGDRTARGPRFVSFKDNIFKRARATRVHCPDGCIGSCWYAKKSPDSNPCEKNRFRSENGTWFEITFWRKILEKLFTYKI